MASEDTIDIAESEEENAKVLQQQAENTQAKIDALQRDIDQGKRLLEGLQHKQRQHAEAAQKLRQKAADEKEQEQQERLRREQDDKEGRAKKAAKEAIRRSIF